MLFDVLLLCIISGVLLKMEVGIRKGAWRRAWRYPAYLWSLRWVYVVKKNPEVGIRRISAYTPQYTTVYYPDYRITARQNFFSVCVVQLWNKLPEEVVAASSVSACISCLNSMHVSFLRFCSSAVCFIPLLSGFLSSLFSVPHCLAPVPLKLRPYLMALYCCAYYY